MKQSPFDRLSYLFEFDIVEQLPNSEEQVLVSRKLKIPKIQFRFGVICLGGVKDSERKNMDAKFEQSLNGCMRNTKMRSIPVDPSEPVNFNDIVELSDFYESTNTEISKVAKKCKDKNDQCKIEKSDEPNEIKFDLSPIDEGQAETIGLGFVTSVKDCVLFYRLLSRNSQSQHLLLQLKNGRLVLSLHQSGSSTVLEPARQEYYSDNSLHHVYIHITPQQIKLTLDQKLLDKLDINLDPSPADSVEFYLAGVPQKLRTFGEESLNNFDGCFTQIIYNEKQLDLDQAQLTNNPIFKSYRVAQCYKVASALFDESDFNNKAQMTAFNKYAKAVKKIHLSDRNLAISSSLKNSEECVLSRNFDNTQLKPVGLRFGLSKQSRLEVHDSFPIKISTFISFKFRTLQFEGLMFYASDAQFSDFLAVWMQDGRVNYAFDCGSGFVHIKTDRSYNDGRYHTVTVKRDRQKGFLIISDRTNTSVVESVEDEALAGSSSLSVVEPYYFGSIPDTDRLQLPAAQSDLISTEPFIGCMTDFNIAHKSLKNRWQEVDLMNCSNNHESGLFFKGQSLTSHSMLENYLSVKNAYEISFEIKSRTKNGVLLYVGGKEIEAMRDYVLLELVDGELVYSVRIGGVESLVKLAPEGGRNEVCNSNWIRVKITKEERSLISLEVRGIEKKVKLRQDSKTSSSLMNVYLGALPTRAMYAEITQTNEPFVGCIRDFVVKKDNGYANKALLQMSLEPGLLKYCPLK